MKRQKTLGIFCILAGAAMIFFSNYISKQVAEGKIQIRKGEQAIKATDTIFGMSKYSKPIGEGITSSGKKQIAAGEQDIAYYSNVASGLKIGGFVLIIVGLGLLFIGKRKK